jgi:peptide deformylase
MALPVSIVQAGDPVLRGRAADVPAEMFGSPELLELVDVMVATMRAAPGVGLAAPQIGIPLRLFVAEDPETLMAGLEPADRDERGRRPFPLRAFLNPVLRSIGTERATFFEGCLSVEGYAGLVERHLTVELSGLDERGTPVNVEISGWPARIFQHELDHLDGTLYIDRMLTRSFAHVDQLKAHMQGLSVAEIRQRLGV